MNEFKPDYPKTRQEGVSFLQDNIDEVTEYIGEYNKGYIQGLRMGIFVLKQLSESEE